MEVNKIVLRDQGKKTSEERDADMLRAVEKNLGTGPIIGEAREVLLSMSRNIMVRDLLLDAIGVTVERREQFFRDINKMMAEQDKKILAEREKE